MTALTLAPSTGSGLQAGDEVQQYLTFTLGQEIFAVGILAIKEILRYHPPTEVPMAPNPWLVGVINLRGRVVPVVDLAARLGRKAVTIGRRTCIVITEIDEGDGALHLEIGLVIDAVRAVVDIPHNEIESPPAFGVRLHPEYMIGVVRQSDLFVVLLDLRRILSVMESTANA